MCSDDLRDSLESYLSDHSDLTPSEAAKNLSLLRQNGYPFAQANVVFKWEKSNFNLRER